MKKDWIALICAFILTCYSVIIAVLILQDNYKILFNILWSMSGMVAGIGGIIIPCNIRTDGKEKYICRILTIIAALSTGVCGLNFMACVMCNAMWFSAFI